MNTVPRSRWVMRGLLLFTLCFANLNDIWSPDVLPNALLPFTLLREGNVNYDEFTIYRPQTLLGFHTDRIDREAYFFRACGPSTATEPPVAPRSKGGPPAPGPNDHVCSVFPPGMGLLALPFFLPFIVIGFDALDLGLLIRVGHVAAAFYETIAALLLWAVLRRIASERQALALVLLYFLGTSVRTVSSQALWQHAGVHLAIALALWLTIRAEWVPWRREFLAGLSAGAGALVRQTTVIIAPVLGVAHIRKTQTDGRTVWETNALVPILFGATLGALPLLAYNWLVFGSPLEQGYGAKPFDTPILEGLYGLLFSPSRGLFVYEPWAVLGIAGLVIARFANTTKGVVSTRIADLLFAWVVFVIGYATYAEWWGGRVFGPRFLDDLAPIVVAGLAWGVQGGWFALGFMRAVFWASAAWSILIFNAAAFVYDQNRWDTVPVNVNDDPSRLFSWSDPQWLAVLRELPSGGPKVVVAIGLTVLVLLFLARIEGVLARRVASPA